MRRWTSGPAGSGAPVGWSLPARAPAGPGPQLHYRRRGSQGRNRREDMPHSIIKELIFGLLLGTTGISLLVLWYHKVRRPKTTTTNPSRGKKFDSITLQDEMHNDQGTAVGSERRQLQILEKLNELMTNMEELKEEVRFLKETIPKLEEYIQDELGGKVTVHKISPQHRARKRKLATVQTSATRNSSEEAESEGGHCPNSEDTAEDETQSQKSNSFS